MPEVMVDILGRATCIYNVDSDTLDQQGRAYLSLSQLMLPTNRGDNTSADAYLIKYRENQNNAHFTLLSSA